MPSSSSRPTTRRRVALAAATLLLATLAACGDDANPVAPAAPLAPSPAGSAVLTRLEPTGDGQTGTVGARLEAPIAVVALDQFGQPIAGAQVSWRAFGADAELTGATASTDAAGAAHADWRLGTFAGTDSVVATVTAAGRTLRVAFTAAARAGAPDRLEIVSGDEQSAPAGEPVAAPLVVRVLDRFGNPVIGQPIEWSAEVAGIFPVAVAQTDERGVATTSYVLDADAGMNPVHAVVRLGDGATRTATFHLMGM